MSRLDVEARRSKFQFVTKMEKLFQDINKLPDLCLLHNWRKYIKDNNNFNS